MKTIHISDLHYRTSRAKKINHLVDKIIEQYSNEAIKPVIIISGDLVESPRKERMLACYQVLIRLKEAGHDLLICPGNHDVKKTRKILHKKMHGAKYSASSVKRFNKIFKPLLPTESWNLPEVENDLLNFPKVNKYGNYYFIGLDSNNTENFPTGTIGTEQKNELKKQIQRIKEEDVNNKIIIYLHHNLFWFDPGVFPGRIDGNWLALTDRYDLRKILKNQVDAIMFGHFHVNTNYSNRADELGNPLMQLAGDSVMSSGVRWFEFDLENNKINNF